MATDVQRFFDEYARAAAGRDPEDVASYYDDHLVHAGPKGALGFANDGRYRSWLTDVLDFNEASGLTSFTPAGVGSYDLGPALVIATVQWQARFARADQPAQFTVTYLLRRAPDGLRILCAAAHEDQEDQMKALGVTPQDRPRSAPKRQRRQGKAAKAPKAQPPHHAQQ